MTLIDLSHPIGDGTITYPGLPAPRISDYLSREASATKYANGTTFHIARIELVANTGTYVDAPIHRFEGGEDFAAMPLEKLADLPGVVIDVMDPSSAFGTFSPRGGEKADVARVSLRPACGEKVPQADEGSRAIDAAAFAGITLRNRAVVIRTGFSRHFGTPAYGENNPFLTRDAAEHLVREGAALVGIDSLNVDDTADLERPAHTILLRAGIPIVEHMTNLAALPSDGFRFFAVPPRWHGVGSFPVRAFAIVGGGIPEQPRPLG